MLTVVRDGFLPDRWPARDTPRTVCPKRAFCKKKKKNEMRKEDERMQASACSSRQAYRCISKTRSTVTSSMTSCKRLFSIGTLARSPESEPAVHCAMRSFLHSEKFEISLRSCRETIRRFASIFTFLDWRIRSFILLPVFSSYPPE